MTTTAARTTNSVGGRGLSSYAVALLLPIGPAAVAVLRYALPYYTVDDSTAMANKVIAATGRMSLVLWLGFIAVLTLVPAAYAVSRVTRQRAPRMTLVAMLLLVPGYLALGWLIAEDQLMFAGAKAGLDAGAITRLIDHLHPSGAVAGVFFVLGHVVGTILLGIALWRTRVVARWAAVAVIASQPIHFFAAVIVPNHTIDLIGWGLQAVGFAAVGWAILQRPDTDV
ncbi:hypothetical protein EV138_5646 [Kribbella voronezhensis]|uniref:DUF4386 family protein n=1 Tax=Kribbella voronezhensis TaxID=2512212 RepID=A0A4R7SVI4_9ACTN|nr:hypothetical protein [Kribbella voronezhensis]TDU83184.1 hypothetical protein EV138_5646 [Kribbella voronezhensis]